MRIALVHASKRHAKLSFPTFLKDFVFLWFVEFIDLDNGPTNLGDWNAFKSSSDLFLLFRIVKRNARLSKDFLKRVNLAH